MLAFLAFLILNFFKSHGAGVVEKLSENELHTTPKVLEQTELRLLSTLWFSVWLHRWVFSWAIIIQCCHSSSLNFQDGDFRRGFVILVDENLNVKT